jgi:hypothetical protein
MQRGLRALGREQFALKGYSGTLVKYTHMVTPHRKVDPQQPFQMHDLLTDGRYSKQGTKSYVELKLQSVPAHILRVRRRLRRERDFDYFL